MKLKRSACPITKFSMATMKLPVKQSIDVFMHHLLKYPNTRLCGLDMGTKSIGVSISDRQLRSATALGQISRTSTDFYSSDFKRQLERLMENKALSLDHDIAGYVIGQPLYLSGQSSEQHRKHINMLLQIESMDWKAIFFIDERLSTASAYNALLAKQLQQEGGYQYKKRKNAQRRLFNQTKDEQAAEIILQRFLDRASHLHKKP